MKDQILKIAGVKSEKEFYKKYPTEESFMAKHGKKLEKLAMGKSMVNKQLKQLTDFGNPPIAQNGAFQPIAFNDLLTNAKAINAGITKEEQIKRDNLAELDAAENAKKSVQQTANIAEGLSIPGDTSKGITQEVQDAIDAGFEMEYGGYVPQAQFGDLLKKGFGAVKDFTKSQGGLGNMLGNVAGAGSTQGGGFNLAKGATGLFGGNNTSGAAGKAGPAEFIQSGLDVFQGVGKMKEQKKAINAANQQSQLTGVTAQAAESKPVGVQKHNFARPEQALVQPNQLGSAQGTGSDFLQMQSGGEIQNTYAPYTLYDDLGEIPTAEFGDYFQDSGQAQIGKGIGTAIGNLIPIPGAGKVLGAIGSVAGNLLGGADDANKLARYKAESEKNTNRAAFAAGANAIQSQNSAFMKEGGWVSHDWQPQVITQFGEHKVSDLLKADPMMNTLRAGGHLKEYTPPSERAMYTGRDLPYQMEDGGYMAMGGALQTHWGGEAEHMSYNPYIPGGGETVMFRGQSHDETNGKGQSGIGITYGDNPVEVERGEPMTEMADGGVVFGNMKINKLAASEIGDPKAKGKKFKNYVADLSKTETKQNKILDKASKLALDASENTPFGRLALNSSQASIIGANMKLKNIAQKKQDAAAVQNAILDTADEMGLVADELAQGKIKQAKLGKKIKKARSGETVGFRDPITHEFITDMGYNTLPDAVVKSSKKGYSKASNIPTERNVSMGDSLGEYLRKLKQPSTDSAVKDKNKLDWNLLAQTVLSRIDPYLRPTNQMDLDPNQLMGEYYALANNQLEPVQAQLYNPQLGGVMDVSYQDQLNEITAQARAAERMMQNNPEAAANLFAQVAQAKGKVLAEQTRANMLGRKQVYDENRNLLNQAQLQNLQILDNQYTRQAQAKSNTKAQAQAALNSIADKIAKNKLENRELGILENMYGFRFDKQGRAISYNTPPQFNMSGKGSVGEGATYGGKQLLPIDYDDAGNPTKFKTIGKDGKKVKSLNSSIVKAAKLKNI